ncbi:outer membrane protein assembly factor BamB family protein [Occultella gossypii]|uniref:PQQ-binding-like beta-propeller repeat protein n=1 Tax=Occultella gossypii TaxID=2800820 RepID=A0ABS7SCA2_9MICO|nr:PQQ-binding-like beta-propeller repeat protein [Occultella gossypii]MBZ2197712.1 PQQ-binding-like beta-propeller repeat protein [Occultella gossypii]
MAGTAAAALLVAGCGAGAEGQDPGDEPSSSAEQTPTTTEPSPEPTEPTQPPEPDAVLGDWVELPPNMWLVASDDEGRAAFSVGETWFAGDSHYGDLAAYDVTTGEQLWDLAGVRQNALLARVESTGTAVVSVVAGTGGDLLVATEWATGEPRWQVPIADLDICSSFDISALTGAEVVVLTASASECDQDEGVVTLDAATGAPRDTLDLPGSVWPTEVGDEIWAVGSDDADLTAVRFDPVTGDSTSVSIPWSDGSVEAIRTGYDRPTYWIEPFDDDVAVIGVWNDSYAAAGRIVLDWVAGVASEFTGAADCFHEWVALNDAAGRTCLAGVVYDDGISGGVASFSYDGQKYWELPGAQAGFVVDGFPAMDVFDRPMESSGWLVSTGGDLLTLMARTSEEPLWVAGAGEGSGAIGYGYLAAVDVVVASLQTGPGPEKIVITVDAATGAEIDRLTVGPLLLRATDTAVGLAGDDRTLVRVVRPG